MLVVFAQSALTVTFCTNCYSLHILAGSLHELPLSEWPTPARTVTCSTISQTALAATVWMNRYGLHEFAIHTNCRNWQSAPTATCCRRCQTAWHATGWLRYHNIHGLLPCARTVTVYTNHDNLPELATWRTVTAWTATAYGNSSQLAGTTQLCLTAWSTVKKKAVEQLITRLPHFLRHIKLFIPFARACHWTLS